MIALFIVEIIDSSRLTEERQWLILTGLASKWSRTYHLFILVSRFFKGWTSCSLADEVQPVDQIRAAKPKMHICRVWYRRLT